MSQDEEKVPLLRPDSGTVVEKDLDLYYCGPTKQDFFVENGAVNQVAGGAGPSRSNQPDDQIVAPGGLVVNSVDEVPPPSYTTVTGGTPVVTCRVCQVKSSWIMCH